jgi:hypothetical protein
MSSTLNLTCEISWCVHGECHLVIQTLKIQLLNLSFTLRPFLLKGLTSDGFQMGCVWASPTSDDSQIHFPPSLSFLCNLRIFPSCSCSLTQYAFTPRTSTQDPLAYHSIFSMQPVDSTVTGWSPVSANPEPESWTQP